MLFPPVFVLSVSFGFDNGVVINLLVELTVATVFRRLSLREESKAVSYLGVFSGKKEKEMEDIIFSLNQMHKCNTHTIYTHNIKLVVPKGIGRTHKSLHLHFDTTFSIFFIGTIFCMYSKFQR